MKKSFYAKCCKFSIINKPNDVDYDKKTNEKATKVSDKQNNGWLVRRFLPGRYFHNNKKEVQCGIRNCLRFEEFLYCDILCSMRNTERTLNKIKASQAASALLRVFTD